MDLICFADKKWHEEDRFQKKVTRLATSYRVFFVEGPLFNSRENLMKVRSVTENILIITPCLKDEADAKTKYAAEQELLLDLFDRYQIHPSVFWYCTPMALMITKGFSPDITVYDCSENTYNPRPDEWAQLEREMFNKAEVIFTARNVPSIKKQQDPASAIIIGTDNSAGNRLVNVSAISGRLQCNGRHRNSINEALYKLL